MTTALSQPLTDAGVPSAMAGRPLLRQLAADGVRTLFTVPGGPLMRIYEELHALGPLFDTVLARHEAGAVFAADGYARASGRMAGCLLTAGPGSSNAASALAVAMRDMVPLFVIAAMPPLGVQGKGAAQELDTPALLREVTKDSAVLLVPERAAEITRGLLRSAQTGRKGPVVLFVPADVAGAVVPDEPPLAPARYRVSARPFDPEAVVAAARVLVSARCPRLLVGMGAVAAGAGPAVRTLAERLGCLVSSTPRAKGIFPETHPLAVGPFGMAGSPLADRAIAEEADVLLVLGSRLGELSSAGWSARLGLKRIIQVDIEPGEIGRNYAVEVGVVGDARAVVEALLGALADLGAPAPPTLGIGVAPWWLDEPLGSSAAFPLDPRFVMTVLREIVPPEAHIFSDIGNGMCWAIRYLPRDLPGRFHVNLTYGCMGHALPAAIGAVLAEVGPVISLVGDAAFAMTSAEIAVAAEHNLRGPVWIVLDNGGNGMCHVGFKIGCGGRAPSSLFRRPADIMSIARANGAEVFPVTEAQELAPSVRRALALGRPALVHVPVDLDATPPMGRRLEALSFGCPQESKV